VQSAESRAGAKVQKCKGLKDLGAEVQRCRYKGFEVLKRCRRGGADYVQVQRFSGAEVQRCRDAEMQRCRSSDIG